MADGSMDIVKPTEDISVREVFGIDTEVFEGMGEFEAGAGNIRAGLVGQFDPGVGADGLTRFGCQHVADDHAALQDCIAGLGAVWQQAALHKEQVKPHFARRHSRESGNPPAVAATS